ncbi:putative Fe(2+)-trafficking protein [Frankliniella fusca]|uniref:Fe(2+)-trafficking protein n=1 Tax=Frankliniella fusca TaxID=407009 RepID=A0AAE1HXT7_9NEOP|nr:putative Fe(2+)-trafficking protein [Frankliniella fusca]
MIITGDVNVNFTKSTKMNHMQNLLNKYHLHILTKNDRTHLNTTLDWALSNSKFYKSGSYMSFFSYHFPIWIQKVTMRTKGKRTDYKKRAEGSPPEEVPPNIVLTISDSEQDAHKNESMNLAHDQPGTSRENYPSTSKEKRTTKLSYYDSAVDEKERKKGSTRKNKFSSSSSDSNTDITSDYLEDSSRHAAPKYLFLMASLKVNKSTKVIKHKGKRADDRKLSAGSSF